MSGYAAAAPIGVYRPGSSITEIEAYEKFLGGQVDRVLDFMPDQPTWAQFESATLAGSTNGPAGSATAASAWGNGQLGTRQLVLAVPACVQGSSWLAEDGGNDAHWQALGVSLVDAGLGGAVLRIGREFNGSWYPWHATEGAQQTYINGYRHVVSVLRSVPGAAFSFCWNPTLGVGTLTERGAESCYPGDDVVDDIGVDAYDWVQSQPGGAAASVTTAAQQAALDKTLTEWDSLRGWYSLALAHRKPLSFPEWGLVLWKSGATYLGGGDDPGWIRAMAALIGGSTLGGWHALWEDTGMGVFDPDDAPGRGVPVPMARAEFLAAFSRA